MRLIDEERAAIDDLPSWPEDIGKGSYRIATDVLDRLLARDAERTHPVTPAWLDGPEGRRLGFRVPNGAHHWETPVDTTWCQVTRRIGGLVDVTCLTRRHVVQWEITCNTVAQVRAAVFLATGRE